VSCLDQLVLEVLNLEVYIVPHRIPSTLSLYFYKVERSVRVQFNILYASTDIYVNIFFIFISPHSFPVTPGEKIPQVSMFVVLSVLRKKSSGNHEV